VLVKKKNRKKICSPNSGGMPPLFKKNKMFNGSTVHHSSIISPRRKQEELLLIFSRFKRCSTWDPVNSNSRLCVTKQLVASNRRKRGRHHVAKRSLSPYSLLLSTSTVYDTMLSNPSMGYIYGIVYIFFKIQYFILKS
jgi:hypothetical protein